MNYYSHHIGDYTVKTAHLSILEDGVYRRLMDRYYTTEQPLTLDDAALFRVIRARTDDEKEAVRIVLDEFFIKTSDGWTHKRCEEEIALYQSKAEKNKINGAKGGRPVKSVNPEITQVVSENNPNITLTKNQEPRTINQEPVQKKIETLPRGTRLASDWVADGEHIAFCKAERPDLDPRQMQEKFRDYWTGIADKRGIKANWLGTWKNFIRSERSPPARGSPTAKPTKFDPLAYVNRNRLKVPDERTIDIDTNGNPIFEMVQSSSAFRG